MHSGWGSAKRRVGMAAAALGAIAAACSPSLVAGPTVIPQGPAHPTTPPPPWVPSEALPSPEAATIHPPTWAPLPTIQAEALDAHLITLLMDDACHLPCWWNILAGTTTWEDALQVFQPIGSTIQPGKANRPGQETFYVQFPLPGSTAVGGASFNVLDGIVQSVFVGGEATSFRFQLGQLLTDYGTPDAILIRTFASAPEPYLPFRLALVYQQRHFLASYEFEARVSGSNVVGCPRSSSPTLHIRSSSHRWSDEEIQTVVLGVDPSHPLLPLAEVTDLNASTFVTLFAEANPSACIESPAENW